MFTRYIHVLQYFRCKKKQLIESAHLIFTDVQHTDVREHPEFFWNANSVFCLSKAATTDLIDKYKYEDQTVIGKYEFRLSYHTMMSSGHIF